MDVSDYFIQHERFVLLKNGHWDPQIQILVGKPSVWDPPWNFKSPTPWGPRGFEILNSPPHGAPGF